MEYKSELLQSVFLSLDNLLMDFAEPTPMFPGSCRPDGLCCSEESEKIWGLYRGHPYFRSRTPRRHTLWCPALGYGG